MSSFTSAFAFPSDADSDYSPSSLQPPVEQVMTEYSVIPLSEGASAASPYCDILSNLQDQTSPEVAKNLDAFIKSLPPNALRPICSALARLTAPNILLTNYQYVVIGDRGKATLDTKAIGPTAPLAQGLLAARLHNVRDVKELVSGWKDGRHLTVDMINGGFPTVNPIATTQEYIADFAALKGASSIAGKQNPVTAVHLDWIKKNHGALKNGPTDKLAVSYAKFATAASNQVGPAVTDFAKHLYSVPSTVRDNFESEPQTAERVKREYSALCIQWRNVAREAQKTGRASRGEDNPSPLTTPYYRFPGAPKVINRLAWVLAMTGGKIASTSSPAVSTAFGVTEGGWHVYMDSDVPLETLLMKLSTAGHMNGLKLAQNVLVQLNLFATDTNAPVDKLFNFLIANRWNFGWAIHDGYVFLTSTIGNTPDSIPKMFATIAAVNNLRTLNAHASFITLAEDSVMQKWYGPIDTSVNVPSGAFTGLTFEIDFGSAKKAKSGD